MNYLYKFASFLFSYAGADDSKKLLLLKKLDEYARTDEDFDRIKAELFDTNIELWGHLFSAVKKNPAIRIDQFIAERDRVEAEKAKKDKIKADKEATTYTEEEKSATSKFNEKVFKDWALRALKDSEVLRLGKETVDTASNKLESIHHYWLEKKVDLFQEFQGPKGFEKAFETAEKWERDFGNTTVTGYVTNHVVYTTGPWKIVEIKGSKEELDNDLKLEGKIMGHCVGGYTEQVMSGQCRIFSLRSSNNAPNATIETDSGIYQFKQIYGPGNKELESEKFSIISEWKQNLHPKDKIIEMSKSEYEQDKINAAAFMDYNDPDYAENIKKLIETNSDTESYSFGVAGNENSSVYQGLSENETLPAELYWKIYDNSLSPRTKFNLARNSKIPDDLFQVLAKDENLQVLQGITSSRKIKDFPEIIENLFKNKNLIMLLLNNPSIPSSICINYLIKNLDLLISLQKISSYKTYDPKFIDDLIISLIKRQDDKIHNLIVRVLNSNDEYIKRESLFKLLNKLNKEYSRQENTKDLTKKIFSNELFSLSLNEREKIASTTANPDLFYLLLSDDSNESGYQSVKLQILKNKNIPKELIKKFCDENINIINNKVDEHTDPNKYEAVIALAKNPTIDNEILFKLLKSKNVDFRRAALCNSKVGEDILLKASRSDKSEDRESVARNIATPPAILNKLSKDPIINVRSSVAFNTSTPLDVLENLIRDQQSYVGNIAIRNITIPEDLLFEFSRSLDYTMVCGVAKNAKTPIPILLRLLNHKNDRVRTEAKYALQDRGLEHLIDTKANVKNEISKFATGRKNRRKLLFWLSNQ